MDGTDDLTLGQKVQYNWPDPTTLVGFCPNGGGKPRSEETQVYRVLSNPGGEPRSEGAEGYGGKPHSEKTWVLSEGFARMMVVNRVRGEPRSTVSF